MDLPVEINKFKSITNLYNQVRKDGIINLTNVKGGLQGFIALSILDQIKSDGRNTLMIFPTEVEARERYAVIKRFNDKVLFYPTEQVHYYFSDANSNYEHIERQQVLEKVLSGDSYLIICSIEALLKKLPPVKNFLDAHFLLKVGEDYNLEDLIETLNNYEYERSYQTEAPGQYSVRGEILDVFVPTEESPVRIDFFDTEIESLKYFDPFTQRSVENIEKLELLPANENWLNSELREGLLETFENKYQDQPEFQERLEMLETMTGPSNGILLSLLKDTASIFDYLKYKSGLEPVVLWSSPEASIEEAREYLNKMTADYEALQLSGDAFIEEKERYYTVDELTHLIESCPLIKLFVFTVSDADHPVIDMNSSVLESFAGQPKVLKSFLEDRLSKGYYIHFFARDEKGLNKLKEYVKALEVNKDYDKETGSGIEYSIGEISEGFELSQDKIVFLNESDFFKEEKKRRSKETENTRKIENFSDLKLGCLVVHDDYGIGRYRGIEQVDVFDSIKDMMSIEYADGDALYIPAENLDAIQVYIGTGESQEPPLNSLGGKAWLRAKNKAKKAAEMMADELIELYAKRSNSEGYAYSQDTIWQRDFEEAFPFEATEDQMQSIAEIKRDMERPVIMDRLLCGDVGYGKTEVAFRAAFKAAMDHKQTAILVPTTILAQQHYLSALERFKDFDIKIETLSRMRTPKEQREIIKRVKEGDVDIIIGTHRLLSKDMDFHDLGLLVVDEEQRFGVRSKEKIKHLKENVDVLTLSATPIPRTLHMSLSGVRDMSVLEDPPSGRRPVQTYVLKYSAPVIKDAIERELARKGQVYYIHNRVEDIDQVVKDLQLLVPQARIVSAHGQMTGKQLEKVMESFLNKEYDILVSTTIVENGLDVQNANTMIVEEGDHFGLAQLYQLRGRVGRSQRQAYTYITHSKDHLTDEAEQRLKAIRDFTAFGSGFKIAMRDLEIRGAGTILGNRQSGHMVNIGYELYSRILQQVIDEKLHGVVVEKKKDASVQIRVSAYIPNSYISVDDTKYEIYKKIAKLYTWEDYRELKQELIDRFGKIPQSIKNLMLIAMIKNLATECMMTKVEYKNGEVYFRFGDKDDAALAIRSELSHGLDAEHLNLNAGSAFRPAWSLKTEKQGFKLLVETYDFLDKLYEKIEDNKNENKGEKTVEKVS